MLLNTAFPWESWTCPDMSRGFNQVKESKTQSKQHNFMNCNLLFHIWIHFRLFFNTFTTSESKWAWAKLRQSATGVHQACMVSPKTRQPNIGVKYARLRLVVMIGLDWITYLWFIGVYNKCYKLLNNLNCRWSVKNQNLKLQNKAHVARHKMHVFITIEDVESQWAHCGTHRFQEPWKTPSWTPSWHVEFCYKLNKTKL